MSIQWIILSASDVHVPLTLILWLDLYVYNTAACITYYHYVCIIHVHACLYAAATPEAVRRSRSLSPPTADAEAGSGGGEPPSSSQLHGAMNGQLPAVSEANGEEGGTED